MTEDITELSNPLGKREQARLRFLIGASRLALVIERVWPAVLITVGVLTGFALCLFLGAFETLGMLPRAMLLAGFLVLFLASLVPLARKPLPARKDAIARLDRQQPRLAIAASLSDRAALASTPESLALWQMHRARLAKLVTLLKFPRPSLDAARDRYGLRYLLPLLLVLAVISAGPARQERLLHLMEGFAGIAAPPRLDAWIAPPPYTGRASVALDLAKGGEERTHTVPQGSVFSLRTQGGSGIELKINRETVAPVPQTGETRPLHFERMLRATGSFEIRHYGRQIAKGLITVTPDEAPHIKLQGPVEIMRGGSVRLKAELGDDYGVANAEAKFTVAPQNSPADLRRLPPAEPLIPPPGFPLALGGQHPRQLAVTTTRDLTEHPYAGLPAEIVLEARDDAGNEARSDAGRIVLPARPFANPLARALIALRQNLALDRNQRGATALALDLVLAEPEKHVQGTKQMLQLSALRAGLLNASSDDDLRAVLQRLYDVATLIENGDLSDAERALAEAQAKLERLIESNAGADEIAKAMNELRQAMTQYLHQLQARAAQGGQKSAPPANMQVLSEADLERMMKRIEELSRSGAKDAARQQLQALKDLLSALRNSDPSASGAASAMQRQLNDIAGMMQEQQKLMDETYKERNRQRAQGNAAQGNQGAQTLRDLQSRQGTLRDKLGKMREALPRLGNEDRNFGEAEGGMAEAEEQLSHNSPDAALPGQGRALEEMRKGAQSLMRAMRGNQGQGQGGNYSFNEGNEENLDAPAQYNPFNEGLDSSSDDHVPNAAERKTIQDILDEVKRRLSEPSRPKDERDYLERLLKPF